MPLPAVVPLLPGPLRQAPNRGRTLSYPVITAAGTVVFVTMTPSGSRALAACGAQGETAGTHSTRQNLHFPAPSFGSGSNLFAW